MGQGPDLTPQLGQKDYSLGSKPKQADIGNLPLPQSQPAESNPYLDPRIHPATGEGTSEGLSNDNNDPQSIHGSSLQSGQDKSNDGSYTGTRRLFWQL